MIQMPSDASKGLLRGILSILAMPEEMKAKAKNTLLVPPHEHRKGRRIVAQMEIDQHRCRGLIHASWP